MSFKLFQPIIDESEKILIEKLSPKIDKTVLKLLIKKIAEHTENGRVNFDINDLAILENEIYEEIKDSGYNEYINSYIKLYNTLDDIIIEEQVKTNALKANNIRSLWNNSNAKNIIIDKVIYDLGSAGMKDVFVKGLANIMRDINYTNMPSKQAISLLESKIETNSYTQKYIRNTVFDSLNQYDGAFNNEIREAYDFKNFIYVGNTIENSRAICLHLRNTLNGRFSEEVLKQVLNEYCPNGKPSNDIIEIDNKKYRKGGGMIEGTTFENFQQQRGGWGCRHRCLATK